MSIYVLGWHIFASSFHLHMHKKFNEKHGRISGSFTFAAMFVESLTELAEVVRQNVVMDALKIKNHTHQNND